MAVVVDGGGDFAALAKTFPVSMGPAETANAVVAAALVGSAACAVTTAKMEGRANDVGCW